MRKMLCVFLLMLFSLNVMNVYAVDECTTSEMKRLKELAKNVEFKVDYEIAEDLTINEENNKMIFLDYKIEVLNYDNDLKITYKVSGDNTTYTLEPGQLEIKNLTEGKKIIFYIYAYTANFCTGEILKTKTVSLKTYNDYYYFNKDKCSEYPDFNYCKEFFDTRGKSFGDIDKLLEKYIKTENAKNSNDSNKISWYHIVVIVFILTALVTGGIYGVKYIKKREEI